MQRGFGKGRRSLFSCGHLPVFLFPPSKGSSYASLGLSARPYPHSFILTTEPNTLFIVMSAMTNVSSSTPSTSRQAASKFDQGEFVYNLDLVVLAVLAVLVLFSLPRAFTRYTHLPEWFQGLLLHTAKIDVPVQLDKQVAEAPITPLSRAYFSPTSPTGGGHGFNDFYTEKAYNGSDEGHGPRGNLNRNKSSGSAHANLLRNTSTSSGRVRRTHVNLPSHMQGWSSILPSVSHYLRLTIRPGLTVGKAFIVLAYTVAIVYAGLLKSNPFTQPVRSGWVAVSQVPVVIILATKNNVPGMLLGVGYERLNFFHRYAGRLVVLAVNVHALGFIYAWSIAGTFTQHLTVPHYRAGLIALVCADVLAFFSTSFWRNKFYSVFVATHIIGVVVLLGAICMHSNPSVPYVLIAVGAYALDRVLRFVKTRYAYAHLTALNELGMTRIEVPVVNAGWRAGQHVRIRVLSRGMGWFGWAECHPFSIASVAKSPNEEGLVLMCKKAGTWTTKLFDLAKRAEYGEAGGYQHGVRVLIEGPYGGPGHTLFASFSGALFVAGGSGITFALSAVQDLVQKDLRGESRLKSIELVWIVQDPSMLIPLIPTFTDILSQRTYATIHISVHYTQAGNAQSALKTLSQKPLPKDLTLHAGRPKLAQTLSSVIDQACALSLFKRGAPRKSGAGGINSTGPCGVIVGVCGPGGLADDARSIVGAVDSKRRKQVGGVEIHEE
ncbi:unnamed protein product [Somion occarium]|uniref:ferric-chelate reductase (NADPH) n=1 Tax=Somion occarium TaxID=3059160 RepID=A0ABP1DTQ9_9APHY